MGQLDYLEIIKSIGNIPFGISAATLIALMKGEANEIIRKNKLDRVKGFGALSGYSHNEIKGMLNNILLNGLAEKTNGIVKLTGKKQEFASITDQDRKLFLAFDFFLDGFNDWQKKAVTSKSPKILCIAGAGSGKTATLVKRIEFLIKYRSVSPDKILAITFTRKAKQEMLQRSGINGVSIETFNSFSEKLLLKHEKALYERPMKVADFNDRLRLISKALADANTNLKEASESYYGRCKEGQEIGFMNDCYALIEYFKSNGEKPKGSHMIYSLCNSIMPAMEQQGLRDYSDQILHASKLLETVKIGYEHILIDEFQDINSIQMELISRLGSPNLFYVGDPRQSIYGWRGTRIEYILNTEGCEVIPLVVNYRSAKNIVKLANRLITPMGMPDLTSVSRHPGKLEIREFKKEEQEYDFVSKKIQECEGSVFVLSRTNRQLEELSQRLKIPHVIKSEDMDVQFQVVLATVHSIKGMEADNVFVMGCSNFPCKASDHPAVDMVKNNYDRDMEERRLFYVALSRARSSLCLTYTGFLTKYITKEMKALFDSEVVVKKDAFERLREWRKRIALEYGVPAYLIFHDNVLLQIAIRQPKSMEELAEIKGLGPVKLEKYGDEILSIL